MEEEGLSLIDIWKIIMKKRMLVILSFGLLTIATFIFLLYVYNNMMIGYKIEVNYRWYGLENNTYASGKAFNYFDIISYNSLIKAKNSNIEFKDIDVNRLSKNIKIEKKDNNYIISVDKPFCNDNLTARNYLYTLVNIPYLEAISLDLDFMANLKGFDEAGKIYTKLSYFDKQIEMIKEGYNKLISNYGNVTIKDTNLESLLEELEVYVQNNPISLYRYLVYKNTYMTKEEYLTAKIELEALQTEKNILNDRRTQLLSSIENIYNSTNNIAFMDTSLSDYINSLHETDIRLITIDENTLLINDALNGKYNEVESEEFLKKLEVYKQTLIEFTNIYKSSVTEVLKNNTFINIVSYEETGTISVLISIAISFFIGIAGSLLLGFVFGYKYKDDKK